MYRPSQGWHASLALSIAGLSHRRVRYIGLHTRPWGFDYIEKRSTTQCPETPFLRQWRYYGAALILKYRSGEQIRKGDRVLFHGNPAEIEIVSSDPNDPDPEAAWFMKEYGGGVLVRDPMVSGRTFIRADGLAEYEDLEFVSPGEGS